MPTHYFKVVIGIRYKKGKSGTHPLRLPLPLPLSSTNAQDQLLSTASQASSIVKTTSPAAEHKALSDNTARTVKQHSTVLLRILLWLRNMIDNLIGSDSEQSADLSAASQDEQKPDANAEDAVASVRYASAILNSSSVMSDDAELYIAAFLLPHSPNLSSTVLFIACCGVMCDATPIIVICTTQVDPHRFLVRIADLESLGQDVCDAFFFFAAN